MTHQEATSHAIPAKADPADSGRPAPLRSRAGRAGGARTTRSGRTRTSRRPDRRGPLADRPVPGTHGRVQVARPTAGPLARAAGVDPRGKQRTLLAVLLLDANRTVPIRELADKLWNDDTPADPRSTIQKYVMRLRRALAGTGSAIVTEADGYRIEVAPGRLDLQAFDHLLERAAEAVEAHQLQHALAHLENALQLWRAVPPLADAASDAVHREDVPRLVERYLRAVEMRMDIGLQLGRHAELCDELLGLVGRYPLRERFWAQRMRALHGANRQADALTAYRTVTQLLAEEFRIEPGDELRTVHQQILTGTTPDPVPAGTAHTRSPTRQLPMPTAGIVGRRAPIDDIVQTLGSEPAQRRHPLVLVTGPPGVGKTTVAIAAAHRLAPHYPDGQLFAELDEHPFITGSTLGVLQYFLRTLGTPPDALPTRLDDAVATFRSMTADKRLLVVLDGVTDGNAIRTLLPGAVTCGVLITGRQSSKLASLLVSPGGRHVALDVLPAKDALDLLAAVAGEQRVRGEREAARRLVDACGGSPLALRTVAARLATDPGLTIATCVSESAAGYAPALHASTTRPRNRIRRLRATPAHGTLPCPLLAGCGSWHFGHHVPKKSRSM
ncbi:AfsR/SARP family transcriptional regulator [Pseudonocardia cypriaca]|uniref:DNA-binding SARP family transcriptional activator n=1 Tax=Pseudonocardia cypriaca TaxID=882449 RepID=A0A543FZG1_9PSEU|nr:AfsR/SARP family transcriptional regulator [Pseudonocardia cypriaca]TQM39144.1 DNA-binding SARP family transcriptional activator [Pseudonocardia cypriaca]